MRKKIQYLLIVGELVLISILIKGLFQTWKGRERVESVENKKKELEIEIETLKNKMVEVSSPYYLEKVAREQLHLVKPDEIVVIVANTPNPAKPEKIEEITNKTNWWERFVILILSKLKK